MRKILLSASLMCADFRHLEKDLIALKKGGIDFIHVDIMDGHFVPNITLSPLIIKGIKGVTDTPFDVHLMVEEPLTFLDELIEIGVEGITFHIETMSGRAFRLITYVKAHGKKVGIAMNPDTPIESAKYLYSIVDKVTVMTVDPGFAGQPFIPEMLGKIEKLRKLREEEGYRFLIEVDGAINEKSFRDVVDKGADILILGSSGLFNAYPDLEEGIRRAKELISSNPDEEVKEML